MMHVGERDLGHVHDVHVSERRLAPTSWYLLRQRHRLLSGLIWVFLLHAYAEDKRGVASHLASDTPTTPSSHEVTSHGLNILNCLLAPDSSLVPLTSQPRQC